MIVVLAVLGLCVLDAAFVAGCLWATRGQQRPRRAPPTPHFRRVARPTCVVLTGPKTGTAVGADYVAERRDFPAADQAVLDELVLVDALLRGKW